MEEGTKIIGYWILEKKRQKLNWDEFIRICHQEGFILKEIDLNKNLEAQGPFDVFLHKLTDILAFAESGDQSSRTIISNVQKYISDHPEMIVIDPLENIKNLSNRQKLNEMLHKNIESIDVFTPKSIELKFSSITENLNHLKKAGIKFPCICKPLLAHGSSDAHKMMIIFNEKGLKDCQLPCVAQDFINHNAILYKVFIVGNYFHVVERPSLKNFYPKDCESSETLFFSSHDISKSGSKSQWSIISKEDEGLSVKPNQEIFKRLVKKIIKVFGLILVGFDVVIENHTKRYGIIDVNVFPGYDGYPHFFTHLIDVIKILISKRNRKKNNHTYFLFEKCTHELETKFTSDELQKNVQNNID
ncbi:inositol-tetrakisphosphate 1-kinase-like [Chelonus insularis]|uniref:inositol-tetrakisphosphate 1-kinase-like n=1 Tax=Chelonus insularis TaxID=460826 RepID=UPI00158CD5BD|nr:inositol-tetrakisphosphate 1-kinase-like [Chelonus insularis]